MRVPGALDVRRPDAGVDVALADPDVHALAGHALDVGAEEHVRAEEDLGVGTVLSIVVRQDHGVLLFRERADLALERGYVFELQKWLHAFAAAFRVVCSGIPDADGRNEALSGCL